MTIDFYVNFEKRLNSTKRPVVGGLVEKHTLTGYLREPCSVLNPVIDIKTVPVQNAPCVLTYAYISRFYRYYFVKDWEWNNGVWTVYLTVDVLATYRPHIGDTTAYIERCSYEFNTYAIDTLYPTTTEPSVSDVIVNAPWVNRSITAGCYVLGVISGNPSTATGSAVTYYALTYTQLKNLMEYLLSDSFVNDMGFPTINVEGLSHNTAKALFNPIQYITSCIWFPKAATDIGESASRAIKVGYWQVPTTTAEGHWIPSMTSQYVVDNIQLPQHPMASTRGLYLNYAPYTKYTMFLPPFGQLPIDNQYFSDTDTLSLTVTFDVITGKADLRVRKKNSNGQYWTIYTTSSMFGVPLQLAQITPDLLKAATSAISAGAGVIKANAAAATGHPIASMGMSLMSLNSVGNAIEAMMPHLISEGTNGSFTAYAQTAWITATFNLPVDEDNVEQGRPLCEVRTISTIPGYIKCGEATVNFYAFEQELQQIHSMMLSGFFWE